MRRLGLVFASVFAAAIAVVVVVGLAGAATVGMGAQRLTLRTSAVSVPKSSPTLSHVASAGGASGSVSLTDQATLAGGTSNAGGTLTFRLWSDASCTVQYGSSSVITVNGAVNATLVSGALSPIPAGTYWWTVDYSGDANNVGTSTACGASGSSATITPGPLSWSSIGAPTSATSNSTLAVNYPSGTTTKDLLFLVEVNAFGGNSTTPTGWTLLVNQSTNSPQKLAFKVWTRLSGGETSVSLAFKSGAAGSTAWVVRYTRPSGYPPDPTAATSTVRSGVAAASATLTPSPDLTTTAAAARVISFAVVRSTNSLSLSTPNSFVTRGSAVNTPTGGAGVSLAVADLRQPTIGTPASPTWSQSGTAAQWAWATVAWS